MNFSSPAHIEPGAFRGGEKGFLEALVLSQKYPKNRVIIRSNYSQIRAQMLVVGYIILGLVLVFSQKVAKLVWTWRLRYHRNILELDKSTRRRSRPQSMNGGSAPWRNSESPSHDVFETTNNAIHTDVDDSSTHKTPESAENGTQEPNSTVS